MKCNFLKQLMIGFTLIVGGFANAGLIVNEDFENALPTSYTYQPTDQTLGWVFGSATGHMVQNGPWGNVPAQNGLGFAFLQTHPNVPTNGHFLYQEFTLAQDAFLDISFWLRNRSNHGGAQSVNVFLSQASVSNVDMLSSVIGSYSGLSTSQWDSHQLELGMLSAGTYRIGFAGTNFSSDRTAFIDNVQLNSIDVPEPSTLAIFALGMIGLASRRFKKQS